MLFKNFILWAASRRWERFQICSVFFYTPCIYVRKNILRRITSCELKTRTLVWQWLWNRVKIPPQNCCLVVANILSSQLALRSMFFLKYRFNCPKARWLNSALTLNSNQYILLVVWANLFSESIVVLVSEVVKGVIKSCPAKSRC